MVLLPGSPRPVASEDDGIYRSIFQQPQLEVPPTAPSYAWFEFLLHPDALQRHLETLRQQQSQGEHGATSAMELIREFLDQAQLVADEGNGRNHRFRALLAVAARVALQMEISLDDIERSLPTHFQRLLLDGIVDLADAEAESADATSDSNNKSNNSGLLPPLWAHLLHQRWTLRTLVRESNNGYLTSTTKHDAEEQMSGFQLALHELAPRHLQIAQSVQHTLAETSGSLPLALQFDAFYDLACYFFSFTAYEKAYECFSRAAELIETPSDAIKVDQSVRSRLEGYLAACEAVMEARSRAEPSPADGQQSSLSLRQQIDDSLTRHDWESVVELLQIELLTTDELARCPPGHRESVELHALRLVRSRNVGRSSHRVAERPDAPGTEDNASTRALRVFYKRVAISNAITRVVRPTSNDMDNAEQEATNTIVRLLQEDALVPEAADVVEDLVRFTLHLAVAVAGDRDLVRSSQDVSAAMRRLASRLTSVFPFIPSLEGVSDSLQQLQVAPSSSTDGASSTWAAWHEQQKFLRAQSSRQREHFRVASDLQGAFEFPSPKDQEAALALLRHTGDALPLPPADDRVTARNLVLWLALNGAWDVLTQWRQRVDADASLAPLLDMTLATGALRQYVSSTLSATLDRPSNSSTSAGVDGGDVSTAETFTITRCNQLVHDVLSARRALLGETSTEDDEAQELMLDMPLWALDTLVCVVAGLLHRATMRNTSDHRINFDLTPYGDVALLVAFAPEPSKVKTDVSTTALLKTWLLDLVVLHARAVRCLVRRCPRDPRWHSARADLTLHPVVRLKQPSQSDPRAALRSYLVAASLATNHFADGTSVIDIIDQGSLVRLSQCLVKVGAHVPAAVIYQCFAPEEVKYGLRILQLSPESHDPAFFQYFWEMPFLELLVHLHSHPKHSNERHVTLLTHLIQSPELNNSNPVAVQKDVEQRILRCYFRDLCRIYLG
ncbi:hypothetical protein PINS_up014195 [Pythium insidiosum]|nr:hypothetical protein PINS_up014195 [Pythium insidiosum]